MANLESLLNPKSVAVVGASGNPEKVGFQVLKNLLDTGFAGDIYPVNLKEEPILGLLSKASILAIDSPVDLAVVVVPASAVEQVVADCIQKSVKAIVIISAGFAETGDKGREEQEKIASMCSNAGITLLGPNCFGAINTVSKLNTTFAKSRPLAGPISFFSQSGAIIASVLDLSRQMALGFSKVISLGNKAQLDEASVLDYLYNDLETSVILGYLESLTVTPELTEKLIQYSKNKPTLVVFGGKSVSGAKAVQSHTGSIVSSYLSEKTYLEQAGVIVVETLPELLRAAWVFAKYQSIAGKRLAIITNAGGPGILAADAIVKAKAELAALSDEATYKLQQTFRPEANIHNPIDILGDASDEDYRKAIEIVNNDPAVDGIITLLTPQTATKITETAKVLWEYEGATPLVTAFIGDRSLSSAKSLLRGAQVPCYDFPEEAVTAMTQLVRYSANRPSLITEHKDQKATFYEERKAEILGSWGFPVLQYQRADSVEQAKEIAYATGYPLVLKTTDPLASHKSEVGGVKLNITNEEELIGAFSELGGSAYVGKMIKAKHEIFLGLKKDPKVGSVVAFGTGGIYAELYGDFSYRMAPVTIEAAHEMINETIISKVLAGARGQQVFDTQTLAEMIVKASWLTEDFENIKEIDFNPILVDENGYHIVDTRIILS